MSLRSDHKALLFLGGIALLGAAVRASRAVGATASAQPALERQMQAADSAKRSQTGKRQQPRKPPAPKSRGERVAAVAPAAPADPSHRDYRGRLDLDVATAAEIDALPGVGPTLAKRIVVQRMTGGPYRELTALRRVKGVTLKLLAALDSLVAFSGVYKPPSAADTILPRRTARRRR
jgi:competence protein ComEA